MDSHNNLLMSHLKLTHLIFSQIKRIDAKTISCVDLIDLVAIVYFKKGNKSSVNNVDTAQRGIFIKIKVIDVDNI